MKKQFFFIFLILLSNFCNSQIKNGSVLFGAITNTDMIEKQNLDKNTSEMMEKNMKSSEIVDYTLNFNTTESYFFANPILENEKITLNRMITIGGVKLKYYQNTITKDCREFVDYSRT